MNTDSVIIMFCPNCGDEIEHDEDEQDVYTCPECRARFTIQIIKR